MKWILPCLLLTAWPSAAEQAKPDTEPKPLVRAHAHNDYYHKRPLLDALASGFHPSWVMGRKITIDSATMFNKGLEMIEARWLFDIPMPQVDVVVHPQSVVHSMVEFVDGSILSQLSTPDMCLPIQYALTCPGRAASERVQTDLPALGRLDFEAPDLAKFPALGQARRAGETGGTLPAVLNAANEIAVDAFCDRQTSFPGISDAVGQVMDRHELIGQPSLEQILQADAWARETARDVLGLGQSTP